MFILRQLDIEGNMEETTYGIAPKGMATAFGEAVMPVEYAVSYKNRFQNATGDGEKRQGIVQLGTTVALTAMTRNHELVKIDGIIVTMVSDNNGDIYLFDATAETWSLATNTAFKQVGDLQSVQFKEKLIFTNGIEKPIWTKDGVTFTELKPLHEIGTMTGDTSVEAFFDADVTNWVGGTNVTTNDILYNVTLDAYAVITGVASAKITHTGISFSAKGIGIAALNQDAGHVYEVLDSLELNIVATNSPNLKDNTTTLLAGTTTTNIVASAVADFTKTEIRIGDWVRNTTRAALTQVTAVATASIGVHGITGQIAGDSVIFLKSAMPNGDSPHIHYNRLYLLDSRDKLKARISGADDPQDFSRDSATIDTADFSIDVATIDKQSFDFGALQPEGDELLGFASWQRFLAFIGRKNIYFYEGTVPVGTDANLVPVGLFPQGCISKHAFTNLGNILTFTSPNGIESVAFGQHALTLNQEQLSFQINTTLRNAVANTSENNMRMLLYPKRSWLIFKIGGEMWVYNNAPVVIPGKEERVIGSWHLFDGKFAQMNDFLVSSDGTLICCGPSGVVAKFDQDVFSDLGDNIQTEYKTGWLSMKEPKSKVTTKHGKYIKPLFENGENIDYTIRVEAPYSGTSTETITVSTSGAASSIGLAIIGEWVIGGSPVINDKYALRWRGERARFTISTDDTKGKDIISNFTIYYIEAGKE